jgi:tRNA threonylcarbamoyladenosine biosynthesis protein TsaE
MISKIFKTEEELLAFAAQFAKALPHQGVIIFLEGPLGAGKTTFTRGFLRGAGYTEKVKSPTYTLVEPYDICGKKIFHFDLYRLLDPHELEYIGIREYFSPDVVCLIEWPEKGFPFLPEADLILHLDFKQEGREIKMEAVSDTGKNILQQIR